jgi:hypothetical protein
MLNCPEIANGFTYIKGERVIFFRTRKQQSTGPHKYGMQCLHPGQSGKEPPLRHKAQQPQKIRAQYINIHQPLAGLFLSSAKASITLARACVGEVAILRMAQAGRQARPGKGITDSRSLTPDIPGTVCSPCQSLSPPHGDLGGGCSQPPARPGVLPL